jgi:drug/metabolite transporter (DMT)-like permease
MTGVRWTIAGVLLLGLQSLATRRRPQFPTAAALAQISLTALLLLVLGNGLLCIAELRVESGTSALLIATTPIWMLLIDALRARRAPPALALAGVALGSTGVAILVGKGAGNADAFSSAIIVAASVAWAAGSIYARGRDHGPSTASFEMIAGGLLCIVAGLLLGEAAQVRLDAITAPSLWGMLWLITGGAMAGYSAYAYAIRRLPTATVATYAYVTPIVAVTLGAFVLHEPVTWNVVAGGAAVVASVVLILLGRV